jgi:hypothetical protein
MGAAAGSFARDKLQTLAEEVQSPVAIADLAEVQME